MMITAIECLYSWTQMQGLGLQAGQACSSQAATPLPFVKTADSLPFFKTAAPLLSVAGKLPRQDGKPSSPTKVRNQIHMPTHTSATACGFDCKPWLGCLACLCALVVSLPLVEPPAAAPLVIELLALVVVLFKQDRKQQ